VLGQIGEQHSQIETNLFGRLVEAIHERDVVDFTIMIRFAAGQKKFNLLAESDSIVFEYNDLIYKIRNTRMAYFV